jgi:hypothetical protein
MGAKIPPLFCSVFDHSGHINIPGLTKKRNILQHRPLVKKHSGQKDEQSNNDMAIKKQAGPPVEVKAPELGQGPRPAPLTSPTSSYAASRALAYEAHYVIK